MRRCLKNDSAAWDELYVQCHESLMIATQQMLGFGDNGRDLAEELVARVWYSIVKDDGKLLEKYVPENGSRVVTFLRAIARDMIGRHFRAEKRRRAREQASLSGKPTCTANDFCDPVASLNEFLDSLDPPEREFCVRHLLCAPYRAGDDDSSVVSNGRLFEIKARILEKLLSFVDRGQ